MKHKDFDYYMDKAFETQHIEITHAIFYLVCAIAYTVLAIYQESKNEQTTDD